MKFLESLDRNMTAHTVPSQSEIGHSTASDNSSIRVHPASPPLSDFEYVSYPSTTSSQHSSTSMTASASTSRQKARLIYCKSHVSIHPTQFNKDNIAGYLAVVESDGSAVVADEEGKVGKKEKELLIVWVPDEVLQRMDAEDRESFKEVESRKQGSDEEEDGFVFVSLPPPKGEKYAFSVPLSGIYSILVYPPSLQHWYGSATFNLTGGISLPTLFFHDDESPLLTSPPHTAQNGPRAQWGFPPFLSILQSRAALLRSRLITGAANHNAELWLINPTKADREVHEAGIDNETKPAASSQRKQSSSFAAYPPPKGGFPDTSILNSQPSPKQTLLTGLSNITSFSRRMSQQILASPLAQEVVPHLPPAVRSLVNAPGEWERSGRLPSKKGRNGEDVATEFESARLYLARWARVVAEEGERARRNEVAGRAGVGESSSNVEDLTSSLGVFSLLTSPNSKRAAPSPTRTPQHPITSRDWDSFAAQGRDEYYVRREIFKRGFSDSTEPDEKRTRKEGWEVLLGVIPWSVGGLGGGEAGKEQRRAARQAARDDKRKEYDGLRQKWKGDSDLRGSENWKEEWHRIDVDCRRTDRTQTIFAIPNEAIRKGDAEKEAGGPGYNVDFVDEEEGGATRLNPHIAALRMILMTYHTYSPDLGYVQGMSDLLSPIYVVFEANEGDAFWGLVGVMKIMNQNFSREQTGMKKQLSTLQQLIGVMDPELYAHLERTDSLNLFFCFRWILISFKREFKFEDVIRLWEVLWTNLYSNQFVLFVALAVLQSHRDVLIRYLTEFDEVLKYANDLSGTIDLDTTLAQAEVLFLQFKGLIEDLDKENLEKQTDAEGLRKRRGSGTGTSLERDKEAVKKVVSEQLRELLKGFELPKEEEI